MKKASSKSDDPNHDQTDVSKFIGEVSRLVITSMPPDGSGDPPYDGNMRAACTLSLVLALWYGRLGYAKAHAPKRPVSLRIRSYHRWFGWVQALISAVMNESEDEVFFPGQGWDFPFSIDSNNGDFV